MNCTKARAFFPRRSNFQHSPTWWHPPCICDGTRTGTADPGSGLWLKLTVTHRLQSRFGHRHVQWLWLRITHKPWLGFRITRRPWHGHRHWLGFRITHDPGHVHGYWIGSGSPVDPDMDLDMGTIMVSDYGSVAAMGSGLRSGAAIGSSSGILAFWRAGPVSLERLKQTQL